ncbi:MAG: hypothetical protein LBM04_11485, partial [Opitutaceae bacterium]|nr:hypothetical protein [Opitutaceae bacterium]
YLRQAPQKTIRRTNKGELAGAAGIGTICRSCLLCHQNELYPSNNCWQKMKNKIRRFLLISGCIALFVSLALGDFSASYPGQAARTVQAALRNLPGDFIFIPLYGVCAILLYFILKPKS